MRVLFLSIIIASAIVGCSRTSSIEKDISATVTGSMLFSGPNSLQGAVTVSANALAEEMGITADDMRSISVSAIKVALNPEQAAMAESLLLQVVSSNHELTALGTLSPLDGGNTYQLQVAEETDLLPFLNDEGATWVLDINLSEDIMDDMQAEVEIKLAINYLNK